MFEAYSKCQRLLAPGLCVSVLVGCAADSGAVAKPLVFESSTKRAAAITGSGPLAGMGAVGTSVQPGQSSKPGESAAPGQPGQSGQPQSTSAGAAGTGAAPSSSATVKPTTGAMTAAAAGGGSVQPGTQPATNGGATMQPSTAGSSAGSAGTPATASGAPTTMGATPCTMQVTYNAVGMHGMWYPHNIGAVWVEDANGKFIKTLERWAGIRAGYLSHWNMREDQHGRWPSCPFANVCTGPMVPDQMDVMSQATIFEDNAMHMAKWTCKNIDGEVVPDGKYKLFIEEMENISPTFPEGPLGMIEFEKGPSGVTLMPPDQAPFKNLKIVIEPTAR